MGENSIDWNEVEAAAIKAKNLSELFALWKVAHSIEKDYKNTFPRKKTENGKLDFPGETFKDSFCWDGYVTGNDVNRKIVALYVFRESNVADEMPNGEKNDTFWLKENIAGTKDDAKVYLGWIKEKYENYRNSISYNKKFSFDKIAVMNLNKRGGYGTVDNASLKNYVIKYQHFLKRQIEIIDPEIIICGGTHKHVYKNILKCKEIFDCKHPTAWR